MKTKHKLNKLKKLSNNNNLKVKFNNTNHLKFIQLRSMSSIRSQSNIKNKFKFNHKDFHSLKNQLNNLITQDNEYKDLKYSGERVNPMYFIRKNEKKFNTIWNKFRQNPDQFPSDNDLHLKNDNLKDEKDDEMMKFGNINQTSDLYKEKDKIKDKETIISTSNSTKNSGSNKLKENNKDNDKNKSSSSSNNNKDIKNDELIGLHGLNSDTNVATEEMKGVHNLGRFKQLDDGVMRVIN